MKSWWVLVLLAALVPFSARADATTANTTTAAAATPQPTRPAMDPEATWWDVRDVRSGALFVAGALTGFLAHEAGHVIANLAYGNVPAFVPLTAFGFVPFFAISPRISCKDDVCYDNDGNVFKGGPQGKFVITSAGFNVQHITDEIVLSLEPQLRYRVAPFRKGLLAFNTLLSVGYALASWTRTEDPHGDVSRSASLVGLPSAAYASMLFLPAALDLYRYFAPDSRWAPWVSRGAKTAFVGLIFTI